MEEQQTQQTKSIWPKIFVVLGIIILAIIIVAGATIYQASASMAVVKTESDNIRNSIKSMVENKNCDSIPNIIKSKDNMVKKLNSSCANPILRVYIEKSDRPVKCEDIPRIDGIASTWLARIQNLCENRPKLYEAFQNKTLEMPDELDSLLS